jgi:MFS family permease
VSTPPDAAGAAETLDLPAGAGGPRPRLRAQLRELPKPAWILFVGTFVNRAGTFVLPFLTLYLTNHGFSAQAAGGAAAMYGLGGIASQGFGGWSADRLGRRNSIALSMFASAGTTLALARVTSLPLVYLLVFLLGTFAELFRPASSALLTDLVPTARRITAFTVSRIAINLGWAFGLGVGGLLAERSFTWLFVGDAITSAGFGVIALTMLPHGVRTRRHEEPAEGATRQLLADRGLILMLIAIFLVAVVYMQTATTFSLQVRDAGFSKVTYGWLLGLNGLIIVALELPITTWLQRGRGTRIIAWGNLLTGLAFAFIVVSTRLGALVAVIVVWTFGEMLAAPRSSAFVADRAPIHARGRYQAVMGGAYAIAAVAGPLLGTVLYSVRPSLVWWACGVCGLLSAALARAAGRFPAPSYDARPS